MNTVRRLLLIAAALLAAPVAAEPYEICDAPTVVDGDTLKCGRQRLRIWGIQAPDKKGSLPCRQRRPGYVCDDAKAEQAKRALQRLIAGKRLACVRVDMDGYGRPVLRCSVGVDIACQMIAQGEAREWTDYSRGYYGGC